MLTLKMTVRIVAIIVDARNIIDAVSGCCYVYNRRENVLAF